MLEVNNRNIKSIEGLLNATVHLLGVNNMCRIKSVLGSFRGGREKKEKLKNLKNWTKSGMPYTELDVVDKKAWERGFNSLIRKSNNQHNWNMIDEFYNNDLMIIKDFEQGIIDKGLALLCVEKNEILRIEKFLQHYRNLGVCHFLIVDNRSTDGTREYLLQQPDVRLYDTERQYNAVRKSAWQNRMVADYGLNQWYIYVDADEFIWYPEAMDMDLSNYTKALYGKGIRAVKGIMVEMYPKGVIGSAEYNKDDFIEQYRFFDGDSDNYTYNADMNVVYGGVLARLLGVENLVRTKVPLYYHTEERFLVGSHHIFPLKDDIIAPFTMLIKHYKFLPGDEEKVREAIRNQNYANHSMMYRKYVKFYDDKKGISGYYEGSCEWNENSTDEFPVIKRLVGGKEID